MGLTQRMSQADLLNKRVLAEKAEKKALAMAVSLFEKLKSKTNTEKAVQQVKMTLQNSELRRKLQKEIGLAPYA